MVQFLRLYAIVVAGTVDSYNSTMLHGVDSLEDRIFDEVFVVADGSARECLPESMGILRI